LLYNEIMSGIKYSSVVKSEDADGVLEVKLSKEAFIETSYKKKTEAEIKEGKFLFANGDTYDGQYRIRPNGQIERCGFGTNISMLSLGLTYTGEWFNDRMNGLGRLKFKDGTAYEGQFVNGHYQGDGKLTFNDKCEYDGQLFNNQFEGKGVFLDENQEEWVGVFFGESAPGLRFKLHL